MPRWYLIKMRNEKGLSQKEVASFLKCAQNSISRMEQGDRPKSLTVKNIEQLSKVYEVSPSTILAYEMLFHAEQNTEDDNE